MISIYTIQERKFLLDLARRAIGTYLKTHKSLILDESEIPSEKLKENRGVFVTLTKKGELRGCIGHLEPIQPLYQDVIENAVAAAFQDYRFSPVEAGELEQLHLEISVLSLPQSLAYKDCEDLLKQIRPNIDGVIIRKGFYAATFLPQVWEQLPDKDEFFQHLCAKAGLSPKEYKKEELEVSIYQVEAFED